jgi:hypothetical protein
MNDKIKYLKMNDQQVNNPNQENRRQDEISENPDTSAIYLGDSKLQSGVEFQLDKNRDHTKDDNSVTASGVDDMQSNSDGAAGTDRAGTTERKAYGDTELNKGLEDQAKDAES